MCGTQCLLALVALYVGLVHSWDIAVGVGDQLIFYSDGNKTDTVNFVSRNLTTLAYDDVHNTMLYVDNQSDSVAICGFNLHSEENRCFIERNGSSNIHSIAFDPATESLFFTDTNDNSINWISLKPGSVNNVHGNLLIKMDDRTPSDIAVDSCTGYIYWTNTNNRNYSESMERARFNGSGREIIKRKFKSYGVLTLVMDPLTRKMYYFDGFTYGGLYEYEYLNHADSNGQDEHVMYEYTYDKYGHYSAAKELTVSKDYLYWVYTNESYNTVWQLSKNGIRDKEPNKISTFYAGPWYNEKPLSIATNYKIKDQLQGLQDCEALSSPIQTVPLTSNSSNTEQTTEYPADVCDDLFCVHGVHVSETSVCKCTPGYIGERCEVSVCHNYCLLGNCSLNDEGLPTCSCNAGYLGDRCEVYACFGYCLNGGACSLNEKDDPVCHCADNHGGSRCEAVKDATFTINNTPTYYSAERNLTLADLMANWQKPSAKVTVIVNVR